MEWSLSRAAHYVAELNHSRKFARVPGAYRGIFHSFAEARAAAPPGKIGFDHPELSTIYDARKDRVYSSDYPVLYWLREALLDRPEVFDFGGHVGVSYYAYRKYLKFSPELRWRVCDVPQIAESGSDLAKKSGETCLTFCTDFGEVDGFGILLASGSLQYLEARFSDMLAAVPRKPKHILVNKLPLYDGDPFVTLQNTVYSVNPYKIDNRRTFVDSVTMLGYELVDSWENADMGCRIPLHRNRSIDAYTGLYFRSK